MSHIHTWHRPAWHRRFACALFCAAAGLAFGLLGNSALAKEKKAAQLRYAKSYEEAVLEGRARNAMIYVTWHKDN